MFKLIEGVFIFLLGVTVGAFIDRRLMALNNKADKMFTDSNGLFTHSKVLDED